MNLEELQIKISIELKDLEKQLKDITRNIDKTLGPKTTKKLMQDNHRVIKAESIAINKTLNKAFEVDYKKFNTNLNAAMNQAKLTVRSACNDIRRELNNALNVKANIRVTGKTSINGSVTGSSGSTTTASSMASSQYIGAMIIKATNAIIKVNNANTTKLEQAINNLANKLGKSIKVEIGDIQVNVPEVTVKLEIKEVVVKPEIKEVIVKPEIKEVVVKPEIKINVPDVIVNVTAPKKEKKTGSYGNNLPQVGYTNFSLGGSSPIDTTQIETMEKAFEFMKKLRKEVQTLALEIGKVNFVILDMTYPLDGLEDKLLSVINLMKKIHSLRKGLYSDARGFEMGDSPSESHTGRVISPKESEFTKALEEGKPIEVSFKVIDDDIKAQVDEAISRIKQVKLPMSAFGFDTNENTTKGSIKKPFTGSTDNIFAGSLNGKPQKEVANEISDKVQQIKDVASGAFDSNGIIGLMADLFTDLGETIVKDLGNSIESPVYDHMQKIKEQINKQLENAAKNLGAESGEESIEIDAEVYEAAVDAFNEQVKAIKEAWAKASDPEQLEKDLENLLDGIKIAAGIANPINTFFEDLGAIIVRELANSIKSPEFENMQKIKQQMNNQLNGASEPIKPKPLDTDITKEQEKFNELTKQIKGRMADLTNVSSNLNTPGSYVTAKGNELIGRTGKLQSGLHMEDAESKLKKIQEQIKQISDEFDTAISEISSLDVRVLEEGLSSLKDWVPTLQEAFNKLNQIDDERLKINLDTTEAQQNIETLKASLDMLIEACETNNLNAVRNLFGNEKQTQKSKPEPPKPKRTSGGLDDYASKVEKLSARLDDAADDLMEVTRILGSIDDAMSDNGISDLEQCEEVLRKLSQTDLSHLNRDIKKLAESFSGGDFDTSDIDKLVNRLKALKEIRDRLNSINKNAQKGKGIDREAVDTQFRALKDYKNVSFGEGDPDSLGFLPYKQQLDKIVEYAKKAGAKIKEALFGFFKKEKPLENNFDLSTSRDNNFTSKEETSAFQEKELQRWINAQRAAEEQIRAFQEQTRRRWYDILIERSKAEQKLLNQTFPGSLKKPDGDDDELAITIDTSSANKLIEKAKEIGKKIKEALFNSDSQVLGFAPYQNELHELGELAKKIGTKIKKALSVAFDPIEGPDKLDSALTRIEAKIVSVFNSIKEKVKSIFSKIATPLINAFNKIVGPIKNIFNRVTTFVKGAFYGIVDSVKNIASKIATSFRLVMARVAALTKNYGFVIRTHLNKIFTGIKSTKLYTSIASALNKAKGAVSKFAAKVSPTLNKAFSKIKTSKIASGIGKGLNGAKKVLSKFANASKSLWGKIKQIFSKGASDASKATGKLKTGLGNLLKQALGFFSLYSLINLGKQAIEQSQMLAQSEVKLASLMKQRMGATNETISAIRQLAEEQANLGVVSETAMKNGAQQLAMYVHSAKALETLMPAIANLTARRGGVMATPEDAEEVATQLGEAIREGTTTPLEQSGIYLSEAEIQKFAALRTEEERAAYLADVIAKNVGNINEALANTPHGAIAQLKNNFQSLLGTLGIFLANVLKPIVQWLNTIVVACNNALKGLGKLLGFDMTGGAESVPDVNTGSTGGSTPVDTTTPEIDTGGIDDAKNAYDDAKDAADEATEANEKFKGSLMGFDEINILSDNTSKSYDYDPDSGSDPSDEYDPTDITPGTGGQLPAVGDLTETDSIFNKFSDKMKAFLDEVIEPFKNAWDNLGDRWISAWDKLKTSFGNFCSSLAKFMKSVWDNGGKELVEHLAEIGLAIGIAAMEIGGTILDSLAKLWDHLDPEKNMNTQGFLDSLNTMTEAIRDFILDLGPLFQSLMDNGGQDVLNALGDTFMKIGKAAADVATEIVKALHGVFKHVDPGTNEFTRKLLDSLEEFIGKVGDLALSLSGALSKFMSSGGQDFLNNMADVVSIIGDLALTLGSGIIDAVNAFINGWAGQALIEGCAKALAWVSEQLVKLEDVVESIKAVFQDVIDIIVGIFEGDGEKVGRAFANLIKNAFKLSQDIMDWLIDIGVDLILGLIEGLKKTPEIIWNGIKFIFDTIVGFFKELFGIHSPSTVFADLGVNLIEGLIEGITNMASAVWDAITAIVDSILEAFSGIADKLSEIWESIKENVSEAWNTVKDTVVDKCKETYEDVKEKYENIKKTVSDKLEELKEKSSDTWTKVKEKTSDLVSKLKNETEDKYNKLKNKLTETMENWRKNSEDKWNKIKEKTSTLVDTLKKNAEEKYNKMKDALTNTMENWRQKSEEKWTNIKDKTTQLAENLKSTVEDKYNKFKDNLTTTLENWRQKSEEKWTNIKEKTSSLVENLRTTVENKYNTLKTNLGNKVNEIKSDMETKWNNIKETVSTKVENLRTTVENKYNTLKTNLGNKLNEIKSNAQTKWEEVKTTTVNKVSEVVSNATTKYGEMKTNFTNKMNEVKNALGPKWEELKTNAKSGAEGMVKKAGEGLSGLSKTLTDAINKAKTAVSDAWDKVKNIFSGKINMPTLPKLKVEWETFSSSWFPDIKIPKLSWNARGGIIDGITPLGFANGALQMGGEAGKELIVPLEQTSFTSKIAQAMGQAVDNALARQSNPYNNNNNNTMNDNRDIILQINDREFARASINSINKLQRESGKTLLNI